jgi:hypothetical protein
MLHKLFRYECEFSCWAQSGFRHHSVWLEIHPQESVYSHPLMNGIMYRVLYFLQEKNSWPAILGDVFNFLGCRITGNMSLL